MCNIKYSISTKFKFFINHCQELGGHGYLALLYPSEKVYVRIGDKKKK